MQTPIRLAGIDGCRAGWVVAAADTSLASMQFAVTTDLAPLFAEAATGRLLIAIDVPIGLPEAGPRACDRAARALLGFPRGSSVFPAPCRATLGAASYADACRLNAVACGRRVSHQTFNIISKIREVDALLGPGLQERVREAHPEVIFAALGGAGRGLVHGKKTALGEAERRRLLADHVPRFDPAAVRARLGVAGVSRDDVTDAVACLVAARRLLTGAALVLTGVDTPLDAHGLRMQIVA